MLDHILSIIAPHHCCGCDNPGTLLCSNCKYNITSDRRSVCLLCGTVCGERGICGSCHPPFDRAWHVGERSGELQRLIGLHKFERVKAAYKDIAGLLDAVVPQLPTNVRVVPLPTVSGHTRQRGYDHTLLIARAFAKKRGLLLDRTLVRVTNSTQRHATARQRHEQAKVAFATTGALDPSVPYLLIDDVITTGASITFAAQTMRDAGADSVWVAVVARQTLD